MIKYESGVLTDQPRVYGVIVDLEGPPNERYAVKWDGGSTVWIFGSVYLRRAEKAAKK
jgi:hypothetical protein